VPPLRLWERLKHRWQAKVLSVLAAFLLWYQLKETGPVVERALERPLEVIGLGPDRVAVGVPERVLVRIRGEARIVEGLKPEAVLAYLDLSGVEEGPFVRPVRVQLPAGVALSEVVPARVEARVERVLERELNLYAFRPNQALVPEPRRVRLRGPATEVRRAAFALALGGEPLAVVAVDEDGAVLPGVVVEPAEAGVHFAGPLLTLKTLPLALPGPPPELSVEKVEVPRTVRVVGPPRLLADLAFVAGEVEWRVGSYLAPIKLKLPEGVYALDRPWGRFVVVPAR